MLSSICRLCCEADGSISLFNSSEDVAPSQKVIYCCNKTKINLEEDDDLPKLICVICYDQLNNTYNFILQCETADQNLRLKKEQNTYNDFDDCSNILYDFKVVSPSNKSISECLKTPSDQFQIDVSKHLNNSEETYIESHKVKVKNSPQIKVKKKQRKLLPKLGPFICTTCSKECQNNSSLLAHMRSHSDIRAFKCTGCNKTYKDPSGLKRHNDNHHSHRSRNFVCDTCGKCFYNNKSLEVHIRTHTGETPYACTQCPGKFSQMSSLIRHNRGHTGERPFQCLICLKKFVNKADLNKHASVHSQERKYKCTSCNIEYKHRANLKLHMARHISKQCFVCDVCRKSFGAKSYLVLHIKRKHSAESGFCKACAKHVSNIEAHMSKHTGYRGLKCDYCSSSFFNKKGLVRHMSYRHNNKQYKCTENSCQGTFSVKASLNYHVKKVHNNVIPFPCDKCSRGFYRKSDYTRHKKAAHKDVMAL